MKLDFSTLTNYIDRLLYSFKYPNDMPNKITCQQNQQVYIGNNTATRRAWNNKPWIDYWRTFVGYASNTTRCAFCGRPLYVHWDVLDKNGQQFYMKDTDQAVGGHITLQKGQGCFWIVPMCPVCNGKAGNTPVTFNHQEDIVEEKHAK